MEGNVDKNSSISLEIAHLVEHLKFNLLSVSQRYDKGNKVVSPCLDTMLSALT